MRIDIINECTGLDDSKIDSWKPYLIKLAEFHLRCGYASDIPFKIMEYAYATLTFVGEDEIRGIITNKEG